MSRPVGFLLLTPVCSAALVMAASPALSQPAPPSKSWRPPERIVMRLDFKGVPSCADPEPFILTLTPRVRGWDPLSPDGRWRIVVTVKRQPPGFAGSAELHDPKGDVVWTRSFPPKASCFILPDRLSFATAFRIDPGDPLPPRQHPSFPRRLRPRRHRLHRRRLHHAEPPCAWRWRARGAGARRWQRRRCRARRGPSARAAATWTSGLRARGDGGREEEWKPGHVVELTLGKPSLGASYHEPIQVGASGGSVLEVVRRDGALTILAHPDGDAYRGLHLDVECGPGVGLIMAQRFWYPYVEGAEIPVHLDDAR